MVTLFTIPKPFQGVTASIQHKAIQSWTAALESCEVFLCGDDPGVAATASELNLRHIPDIRRNDYGTPLLNDAFEKVARAANGMHLVYLNSDILLLSDLRLALARIPGNRFLLSGRRCNLDVESFLSLPLSPRDQALTVVRSRGEMDVAGALDYFIFPRGTDWQMPAFAVGRPGWDNWMPYRARIHGIPVIDATEQITVVHPNHGYHHVPDSRDGSWTGPEGDHNILLAGGTERLLTLADATHRLSPHGLRRINKRNRLHPEIDILGARYSALRPACRMAHALVTCGEQCAVLCRRFAGSTSAMPRTGARAG